MRIIHKLIVTNEQGQPVSVLIPYEEWRVLERELAVPSETNDAPRLTQHAGSLTLGEDPQTYQAKTRREWP